MNYEETVISSRVNNKLEVSLMLCLIGQIYGMMERVLA